MATDFLAEGLTLNVRKNEASGLYEFGTFFNGAWVTILMRKTGGIDDDIARAADEVAAATATPAA